MADATAGFRVFWVSLLRRIDIAGSQANGYCFQIESHSGPDGGDTAEHDQEVPP